MLLSPQTASWLCAQLPQHGPTLLTLGLTLGNLNPSLNFIHLAPESGVEKKLAFPPTFGQISPPDLEGDAAPGSLTWKPICLPEAHARIIPGNLDP